MSGVERVKHSRERCQSTTHTLTPREHAWEHTTGIWRASAKGFGTGVRRGPPGSAGCPPPLQVPHRAQHTHPDDAQRDIHPRAHITNTTQRTKKMMSIYNLHDRPSTTLQFPPSLPPPPPTLLPLCRAADFRTPSGTTPSTTRRRAGRAVPTTRRSPPRRTMAGPSTRSWDPCRLSAANSARLRNSLARPCKNFCASPVDLHASVPALTLAPIFFNTVICRTATPTRPSTSRAFWYEHVVCPVFSPMVPCACNHSQSHFTHTQDFFIIDKAEFWCNTILPWRKTDSLNFQWNVWKFDRTIADIE